MTLVLPVYNEQAGITSVVTDWHGQLEALDLDFEICAYDDGSRDGSLRALEAVADELPRVVVRHHRNRGHGPTILRGYAEASGQFIAQCDSDGEFEASCFETLWRRREDAPVILGRRVGRRQDRVRRLVSSASRAATRLLFGPGARGLDVNTPLRLMRGAWLRRALTVVEPDTFAPNVVLTGLAARAGDVAQVDVACGGRQWGDDSLGARPFGSWTLWRAAVRAMGQTVAASRRRLPTEDCQQ